MLKWRVITLGYLALQHSYVALLANALSIPAVSYTNTNSTLTLAHTKIMS